MVSEAEPISVHHPCVAECPTVAAISDMVEMMLMQNAQMHQIIMQNMLLRALPPAVVPGGPHTPQQVGSVGQVTSEECVPIVLEGPLALGLWLVMKPAASPIPSQGGTGPATGPRKAPPALLRAASLPALALRAPAGSRCRQRVSRVAGCDPENGPCTPY